jgi:hypothetical protein
VARVPGCSTCVMVSSLGFTMSLPLVCPSSSDEQAISAASKVMSEKFFMFAMCLIILEGTSLGLFVAGDFAIQIAADIRQQHILHCNAAGYGFLIFFLFHCDAFGLARGLYYFIVFH